MIVVTGASGFVGRATCAALVAAGHPNRPVSRQSTEGFTAIGAMTPDTDWRDALRGASSIIHLAARVHVMNESSADPLAEFRRDNVASTLNLARQAARLGVPRFVYVSSIKVNGEETAPGRSFLASDAPDPRDAYGISKREAEDALRRLAAETGLDVVIVRPPLVYGPGVRANFAAMMRLVHRGVPLPLGLVRDNRRSLIAVENLADLLVRCAVDSRATGATFLASDGEDLSTADLLLRLGRAMERRVTLMPVPVGVLAMAARLAGRGELARRLLGSLRIDLAPTQTALAWTPPLSVDEGLRRAAASFRADGW